MTWEEVDAGLYAWDLADEEIEPVLDRLQEDVGITGVHIPASMHAKKRPHRDEARHLQYVSTVSGKAR
jgi:hypothetical protein